ncbi:hypothetical protein CYLTODRAFT_465554 [Cylindrobasidium torrendii FP15055 ss-10]|uniref:DUF6699 domain-containing protein n=1 Tax=Cylindrobasidium torrendii FP15055 ss-10 TaxID=1314674 RepID=A0A0D7B4H9_9AGAR|nr:hypothetical protein CYLTODRAFT_465554 [Cylindrobasidium torrendii FP15055 ss-10]
MSEAFDNCNISEEHPGRVKFSGEVKVNPFNQMLPTGAPPLRSEYRPLRDDHAYDTSQQLLRSGGRARSYEPPAGMSSREDPVVTNPGPSLPARPFELSVYSYNSGASSRQEQPFRTEPRYYEHRDSRQNPQQHRQSLHQPSAQPWPVDDQYIPTQASARPSNFETPHSPPLPHEDYSPPRTRTRSSEFVTSTLRRVFRSGSPSVNPALGIRSNEIQWDMRQSPTHQPGVHISSRILDQPAMSSNPESCMVVKHDLLPWPILVHADIERELTIRDVLKTISESLQTHVGARDLYDLRMSERVMQVLERAAERRGDVPGSYRRVDFLGQEYMFGGLEHIRGAHFRVRSFAS